jgi:microcystin degradation protein MlrC
MKYMQRIAVGGWQHETNTFAPFETDFRAFEMPDAWPALVEGPPLFDAVAGINMPSEGFIQAAKAGDIELIPTLWTSAEPAGYVDDNAFEQIAGRLCAHIEAAGALDGVYLDLHGAMVTRRYDDAEGEILGRVRSLIGPRVPLVASLDFHANVSERMVREADALVIYRTYPHVDMMETGARAHEMLMRLAQGERMFKAYRQGEYLVPLHLGGTEFEPTRSLYRALGDLAPSVLSADIALGFPPSDVPDAGPSIVAYASDQSAAHSVANRLAAELRAIEERYISNLQSPDEAIARALANTANRPVILADTQDNSGAGGASDSAAPIVDLVRHHAKCALVAILADPEFASLAHDCGVGGTFRATLGGKLGTPNEPNATSFTGRFRVLQLGDGKLVCTGPVCRGARMSLGPMALVQVLDVADADVKVVISSVRAQPLDRAMLRHVGVDPVAQRILVLKSSVHFRADFDPIAAETLVVRWPGANPSDPTSCRYTKLRRDVRLAPAGLRLSPIPGTAAVRTALPPGHRVDAT